MLNQSLIYESNSSPQAGDKTYTPYFVVLYIRATNDVAANITCLFQIYEIPVVYGGNLLGFQGFDSVEEMFEAEQKYQELHIQE